ncbi:MAG: 50S ribosomal protein L23 [Bacteroidota bacterium]
MAKQILIEPMISEKTELLSEESNKYTFKVHKDANKIEIKKAIEDMYGVDVVKVNTLVMPAKAKTRMTRAGQVRGYVSAFKKAVITLQDGDVIDFYGDV